MKTQLIVVVALAAILGCEDKPAGGTAGSASGAAASATAAAETAKVEAPRAPRPDNQKTVVDVALGSKDHTTLVTALKAADLVESLDSPGGVYTVFAPTNAAFDKLPAGTVEGLLKPEKKTDLKNILQHHAGVPIMQLKDMKDGQTMGMSDGTKVTFHVKDGKYMVNDANIVASIPAMNGIVHVIDGVLLPPAK
ncbi:MAG TPA: fasciclin domain-containing protein [Polyangiaceae bacterium]